MRRLRKREPYASFIRLPIRGKLTFLWSIFKDPRVPASVKLIPLLLALYVLSPIDLIPDFIPILGALDDIVIVSAGLGLIVRLTPPAVIEDLLAKAAAPQSR